MVWSRHTHSLLHPSLVVLQVLAKFKRYAHVDFNFPEQSGTGIKTMLTHVSRDAIDIIEKLLAYDPEDRMSARQAVRMADTVTALLLPGPPPSLIPPSVWCATCCSCVTPGSTNFAPLRSATPHKQPPHNALARPRRLVPPSRRHLAAASPPPPPAPQLLLPAPRARARHRHCPPTLAAPAPLAQCTRVGQLLEGRTRPRRTLW